MGQGEVHFNEVHVSSGFYTLNEMNMSDYTLRYASQTDWNDWRSSPSVGLGIMFYEHKRFEVGIDASYQHVYTDRGSFRDASDNEIREEVRVDAYSLMPRIKLNWIQTDDEFFKIYISLNVGMTFANVEHSKRRQDNGVFPQAGGQITYLGMSFGKKFGGFFEMGAGTKGLINFGLHYRP